MEKCKHCGTTENLISFIRYNKLVIQNSCKLCRGKLIGSKHFGLKMSEQHKKIISLSNKGRKFSESHKKAISLGLTGIKRSQDTKNKISLANYKRYSTDGYIISFKGKSYEERFGKERAYIIKEKMRIAHKGRVSLRKGKIYNEIYGLEKAENIKNKIKKYIGITHSHFGTKHKKETISKIKEKRKFQKKCYTTSIELKIQSFLESLLIDYKPHKYINIEHGYQCDIFVPLFNLIIEADGIIYHNYPDGREIDKIRNQELQEKGFKVLRLWENDIRKMKLENFKEILNGMV